MSAAADLLVRSVLGVHIDADTRKSCPLPAEILDRARSIVRRYEFPAN